MYNVYFMYKVEYYKMVNSNVTLNTKLTNHDKRDGSMGGEMIRLQNEQWIER